MSSMKETGEAFTPDVARGIVTDFQELSDVIEYHEDRVTEIKRSPVARMVETGNVSALLFLNAKERFPHEYELWGRIYDAYNTHRQASHNEISDAVLEVVGEEKPRLSPVGVLRTSRGSFQREEKKRLVPYYDLLKAGFITPEEAFKATQDYAGYIAEQFYQRALAVVSSTAEHRFYSREWLLFENLTTFIHKLHTDPFEADFNKLHDEICMSNDGLKLKTITWYRPLHQLFSFLGKRSRAIEDVCRTSIAESEARLRNFRQEYRDLQADRVMRLPAFHEHEYRVGVNTRPWQPAEAWQAVSPQHRNVIAYHLKEQPKFKGVAVAMRQAVELQEIEDYYNSSGYQVWLDNMEAIGQTVAGPEWIGSRKPAK